MYTDPQIFVCPMQEGGKLQYRLGNLVDLNLCYMMLTVALEQEIVNREYMFS
jgi:hypothetical protein